jgi:hypothetical protein
MRYLIINEREIKQEQLVNVDQTMDERLHYNEVFSLMHFSCVEVSENIFQVIYKEWQTKYKEVTREQAVNGSNFFSEVRPYGKVLATTSQQGFAYTPASPGLKIQVEITDEIRKEIVDFMCIFAKEIIEDEYNTRFKVLKDTTDLEQASWEIQKHESKEWLTYRGEEGHKTPFLDYIATERELDKDLLATKILEKSEEYEDRLSTMLVDYQKLIKKFESCETVWDLNILYEDYLGIIMPTSQAIELGRTISENNWDRKPKYEVDAYVFKF